jgi:hypothetical protein
MITTVPCDPLIERDVSPKNMVLAPCDRSIQRGHRFEKNCSPTLMIFEYVSRDLTDLDVTSSIPRAAIEASASPRYP